MDKFDTAVMHLLHNEGGLSENPKDPGGITNFGISLRFLRSLDDAKLKSFGIFEPPTDETIRALTEEQAIKIYEQEFWNRSNFVSIDNLDLCVYVFDAAVNMGLAPAIKCLQRACWAVFRNTDSVTEDGILDKKTLAKVNENPNYALEILAAMRSERAGDYRMIVVSHPSSEEFLHGWISRAYEK